MPLFSMSGFSDGSVPSDLLDNRYRFERLIGRGGMGAVYRAIDTRLERAVAIKVLSNDPGADRSRFAAEVRTLARFSHPNLVSVLDVALLDDRPCLVMELIDGPNLAERLRAGPIEASATALIGSGVASALEYVHAIGIVHRDVKPANVLLDSRSHPHLADFGIARLVDISMMTATGMTLGTLAYLAPEQVLSTSVGPEADMYSLGLVLLECLTGVRAFTGTVSEITAARLHRDPVIPPYVSSEWSGLIASLVAREPSERLSAVAARHELERLGQVPHPVPASSLLSAQASTLVAAAFSENATTSRLERAPADSTRTRTLVDHRDPTVTEPSAAGALPWYRKHRSLLAVAALALVATTAAAVTAAELASAPVPSPAGTSTTTLARTTTTAVTTTTASTTTSVTTLPPTTLPTLVSAADALVVALQAGAASGDLSAGVAQQLDSLVQAVEFPAVTGSSSQQVATFDQLVQTIAGDEASGSIAGASTIAALSAAETEMATALQTTVPTPTTAPPQGPGNGPGHGAGRGGN